MVVLAIPRGGVVVAKPVATALGAPLDIVIVRKLGAPDNPELAIGAVTQEGEAILDHDVVGRLRVPDEYLETEVRRQVEEIRSRMRRYRGERPYPDVKGKLVVLVDDGIATGSTIRAAIRSLKRSGASSVVVAAPVGSREAVERLSREADRVVCLETPEPFFAIGQFYRDFDQTTDSEVMARLEGH